MRLTSLVFPALLLMLPALSSQSGATSTPAATATAVRSQPVRVHSQLPPRSGLLAPLYPALVPASSPQTQKRDPLTEAESDAIRELSQDPDKRIKLMLKYTQARLATIEQLEGDARLATGRGKQIHDLLEDFTTLIDELDDNIDEYVDKKSDIRKALKEVVESNTSFQLKLRTLKEQKLSSKEFADYNFVLQNATEAVNSSLDNARQALQELEVALKEEKKKK